MISAHQLAGITGGEVLQTGHDIAIRRVLLDSRKLHSSMGGLFVAMKGVHYDSHRFINDVYASGVRAFIVETDLDGASLPEAHVVKVKSSVAALQAIASNQRNQYHIPAIGITGSNGKTIVKEWLNTLLADDYNIVRSPKSWNSQIGVPLSVMNMESTHTLGIFEAGISQPGEMERLAKVIQPTIGIFTSIGTAHQENFLSRKQLIGEKLTLFAKSEVIIAPEDADLMQLVQPWSEDKRIVFVPAVEKIARMHNGMTHLQLGDAGEYEVKFIDKASIQNLSTCIYCLHVLGYAHDDISERITRLSPLEMRLQLAQGDGDSVIVNDAYSNDLQSLEIALDFLVQHARGRKKTVILSDILQSGLSDRDLHERIHVLLQSKNIDEFIGIGKGLLHAPFKEEQGVQLFATTEDFLQSFQPSEFMHRAILVKGAREFRFERIVSQLQEKTHDTVLEINLNALSHNLHYFKSKLKPETKLMVMVKAFGYGSGAHEVASLLEFNKADYLAVAYTDEGVALRKAGISLPIMVMNPETSSLPALIRYKLEPEIYSVRSLQAFVKALENANHPSAYPIHIKLDTGMHRLGFEPDQLMDLIARLTISSHVKIASVFTHLAATDEPQHDAFTRRQLEEFELMCRQIKKSLKTDFIMHALNTGGISRFTDAQYQMVRLGVGLYGVAVSAGDVNHLQQVGTLKTIISQIKKIKKGDSVGYSRKFIASEDMVIATIPVGYADGLRRSLSNGVGDVLIQGKRCPVVGNVCMDMMMVNISNIQAQEGDEVVLFGKDIPLEEVAAKCQTIPYEILTSISQRVKRVYVSE